MITFVDYLNKRTLEEAERVVGGRDDADRAAYNNLYKDPAAIRKASAHMVKVTGINNPSRATSAFLRRPNWQGELWNAVYGTSQGAEEPRKVEEV